MSDERVLGRLPERLKERSTERPLYLSPEMLLGLAFMHYYRFLMIAQFARISTLSLPHTREILRSLLHQGVLVRPAGDPLLLFS